MSAFECGDRDSVDGASELGAEFEGITGVEIFCIQEEPVGAITNGMWCDVI